MSLTEFHKDANSSTDISEDESMPTFLQSLESSLTKPNNLVSSVSGMDKCVRMVSYSYRFAKAFQMINDKQLIKNLDVLSSKLSFVRTIFLRNRKWTIIQEFLKFIKMSQTNIRKDIQMIFKVFLVLLDMTRLVGFVIKLGLFDNKKLDTKLKNFAANGYFLQCLVWLGLYTYDLSKVTAQQKRKEIKLNIIKYICDGICSYNESTIKGYTFSNKATTTLGVLSTVISLYLSWK